MQINKKGKWENKNGSINIEQEGIKIELSSEMMF